MAIGSSYCEILVRFLGMSGVEVVLPGEATPEFCDLWIQSFALLCGAHAAPRCGSPTAAAVEHRRRTRSKRTHTGHTWVFGSPQVMWVVQPQNILVAVGRLDACTSGQYRLEARDDLVVEQFGPCDGCPGSATVASAILV